MAHTSCMLDKQGYKHACAYARTPMCNIYRFSTTTMIRERTSLLLYTYVACLLVLINNYIFCYSNQIAYIYIINTEHYSRTVVQVFSIQYLPCSYQVATPASTNQTAPKTEVKSCVEA
jgi:hypothetical protein